MIEDVRSKGNPKSRCRRKMHVLIEYSHNHQDQLSMTRNKYVTKHKSDINHIVHNDTTFLHT